jgi:apolipoprotein N-acyltransferase
VPAAAPAATLYSRIGDVFGWLCTAVAIVMAVFSRRPRVGAPRPRMTPA